MPSILETFETGRQAVEIIEKAVPLKLLQLKVLKKGSVVPNISVIYAELWNNATGYFDMQTYFSDYLAQFGLSYQIKGDVMSLTSA